MCGITGILSKNDSNILDILVNSLSIIENRGYDSVGICYIDISNNYNIVKTLKDSNDIKNQVYKINNQSYLGRQSFSLRSFRGKRKKAFLLVISSRQFAH